MPLKTSFFNKTVFKKNLTRFAPVWGFYTLGLLLWLGLNFADSAVWDEEHIRFAYNFGKQWGKNFSFVNLIYAPTVALMLFGDLFKSRMCNALHAMPLRREGWFLTNFLSGLVFCAIPTLLMTLVAVPLLEMSVYENAWMLAFFWLAQVNLQFVCYFGLAVFSVMCTGSPFTMLAGYGLLNFGANVAYALVDTVYTPMLYGVVTPTALTAFLTPMAHMQEYPYVDITYVDYVYDAFGSRVPEVIPVFSLTENWGHLYAVAAVGLLFAAGAVGLYRKRHLECAGDAVAFPILKPVFNVLCALFVMSCAQFSLYLFLGYRGVSYPVIALGLVLGWFVGKMLLERSTRVFRKENLPGLGALALVVAVSMTLTHFDVLNITEKVPQTEQIQKVAFSSSHTLWEEMEDEELLEEVRRLHTLAVETPLEEQGLYVKLPSGETVRYTDPTDPNMPEDPAAYAQAAQIELNYTLQNGKSLRRLYNIWVDSEEGQIARKLLSRWEHIDRREMYGENGQSVNMLDHVLGNFRGMYMSGMDRRNVADIFRDPETARSFLRAVKADCEAGLMAQDGRFHRGTFTIMEYDDYQGERETQNQCLWVTLEGYQTNWDIEVYADSVNTLRWMEHYGMLEGIKIDPEAMILG